MILKSKDLEIFLPTMVRSIFWFTQDRWTIVSSDIKHNITLHLHEMFRDVGFWPGLNGRVSRVVSKLTFSEPCVCRGNSRLRSEKRIPEL